MSRPVIMSGCPIIDGLVAKLEASATENMIYKSSEVLFVAHNLQKLNAMAFAGPATAVTNFQTCPREVRSVISVFAALNCGRKIKFTETFNYPQNPSRGGRMVIQGGTHPELANVCRAWREDIEFSYRIENKIVQTKDGLVYFFDPKIDKLELDSNAARPVDVRLSMPIFLNLRASPGIKMLRSVTMDPKFIDFDCGLWIWQNMNALESLKELDLTVNPSRSERLMYFHKVGNRKMVPLFEMLPKYHISGPNALWLYDTQVWNGIYNLWDMLEVMVGNFKEHDIRLITLRL